MYSKLILFLSNEYIENKEDNVLAISAKDDNKVAISWKVV